MNQEKLQVLYTTRDLSYVGGTEKFMSDFVVHVANQTDFGVMLFETDSHGHFENTAVYESMREAGITIVESINPLNTFWNPENAVQMRKLFNTFGITTVHSFLFNADFTVLTAKLGANATKELLKNIHSFEQLVGIEPRILKDYPHVERYIDFPNWHSTKLCSFSVALEQDTPEWHLRKRIIDEELEPIVSSHTDRVHVVTQENQGIWNQWNACLSVSPCCSIGFSDLGQIDTLDNVIEKENKNNLSTQFCTVSRLVPGKGLELLIDSFLLHLQKHPQDNLVIVGDGELKQDLLVRSQYSPNVQFSGQVSRSEVFRTFLRSDIAVLLSESEGLPLTVQEAMACKLPILATRVGGLPELIDHGRSGVLVDVNDLDTVVRELDLLSRAEKTRLTDMGMEGRKKIEQRYIKEIVFDQIIQTYT